MSDFIFYLLCIDMLFVMCCFVCLVMVISSVYDGWCYLMLVMVVDLLLIDLLLLLICINCIVLLYLLFDVGVLFCVNVLFVCYEGIVIDCSGCLKGEVCFMIGDWYMLLYGVLYLCDL